MSVKNVSSANNVYRFDSYQSLPSARRFGGRTLKVETKSVGNGRYAKVLKAENPETHSPWVIKEGRVKKYDGSLTHEYGILLKLLGAPNTVQPRAMLNKNNRVGLALTWCKGEELFEILKRGTFRAKEVFNIAGQLLKALQYYHEKRKIAHLDVKIENCVYDLGTGELKVIDFGTSMVLKSESTFGFQGTPACLPPETALDLELGFCHDIWCAGMVVFEAYTGDGVFWPYEMPTLVAYAQQFKGVFLERLAKSQGGMEQAMGAIEKFEKERKEEEKGLNLLWQDRIRKCAEAKNEPQQGKLLIEFLEQLLVEKRREEAICHRGVEPS